MHYNINRLSCMYYIGVCCVPACQALKEPCMVLAGEHSQPHQCSVGLIKPGKSFFLKILVCLKRQLPK